MKKGMSYYDAHAESLRLDGISNDKNAKFKFYNKEALDASDKELDMQVKKKVEEKNHNKINQCLIMRKYVWRFW